ncbi:MAG TPA: hypothetical protein VK578_11340 [Edaphobacter sp.]|nr:hypothetical protein [Edaphobacter sp.]
MRLFSIVAFDGFCLEKFCCGGMQFYRGVFTKRGVRHGVFVVRMCCYAWQRWTLGRRILGDENNAGIRDYFAGRLGDGSLHVGLSIQQDIGSALRTNPVEFPLMISSVPSGLEVGRGKRASNKGYAARISEQEQR